MVCSMCGIDFPLLTLEEGKIHLRCGKCQSRQPGLSIPDIAAINVCVFGAILLGIAMLTSSCSPNLNVLAVA